MAHHDHEHEAATIFAVNPFNFAVIGYGLSAKVFHIPFIKAIPDFKLYGVVQRSPKPDNDAAKDHPEIQSWRSVEEAFKDKRVDVVVVTSIPGTHFDMCKSALQAGKHVVVEKPFVPTSKEADELIALAKTSGRLLTVYQNRRWDADYLTLRKIISEGALGAIAEFETHFDRHRPDPPPDTWKSTDEPGHGSIYDLGTHLIDQVVHSFGMPNRVTGFLVRQRKGVTEGAHDSFTVLMQYDDEQMLATVKAGVVSPETEQLRYWVRGTKGSFKKFYLDVQEDQLKAGKRPRDQGYAQEPESHFGTLITIANGQPTRAVYPTVPPQTYVQFYKILLGALKDEDQTAVPVKAEDARDVLRVIEAAKRSADEGKTVAIEH